MSAQLLPTIEEAEGFREKPYKDTELLWTFGTGRCLETNPLTGKEWKELLDAGELDVTITHAGATRLLKTGVADALIACAITFRWWADLDEGRRDVIAELAYQLGLTRLMRFRKLLAAMERRDYDSAATELLDSLYARQVPKRAQRLSNQLRTGVRT